MSISVNSNKVFLYCTFFLFFIYSCSLPSVTFGEMGSYRNVIDKQIDT